MPKGVYQRKRSDPVQRFASYIQITPSGCWEWRASKVKGYGVFWDGDRKVLAHVWNYRRLVGEVPIGLELDHLCRNRACANPDHLEPVTRSENGKRGMTGHHRRIEAAAITHCPKGHQYNEINTNIRINRYGNPYRECKACSAIRHKAYNQKNKDYVNQKQRERYAKKKWRNNKR